MAMTGERDVTQWNTAVGRVRPLHNAAKAALLRRRTTEESDMLLDDQEIPTFEYKDWANGTLSWLAARTEPPTRHAICGYRFATAVEEKEEVKAFSKKEKPRSTVQLSVYDFTPAHVAKELSVKGEVPRPISSNSVGRACSHSLFDKVSTEEESALVSTVVMASFPHAAGQTTRSGAEYAIESPYLVATRPIHLARAEGSFVLHLTQAHLVFVQVRSCEASYFAFLLTEMFAV